MSTQLSDTDRQVLEELEQARRNGQVVPTVREIARALGMTKSTVHNRLRKLEAHGLLRLQSQAGNRKARGIELVREPLPRLAPVAAGPPFSMDAFSPDRNGRTLSQVLELKDLLHAEDFLVEVRESTTMAPVGVVAGDFLVVRKQASAKHGDLVVAITDDIDGEPQPVVGQLVRTDAGQVRLQATDSTWLPIDDSEISLLGVVVASLRKYRS